jgi:hypothetical protein
LPASAAGLLSIAMLLGVAQPAFAATPPGTGGVNPNGDSRVFAVQDPSFVANKANHRIAKSGTTVRVLTAAPSTDLTVQPMSCTPYNPCGPTVVLATSITGTFIEPRGSGGTDDAGHSYTDLDYWNFCAPGAATVGAYYWLGSAVSARAQATYAEPWNGHQPQTYDKVHETLTNASPSRSSLTWNGYKSELAYMAMGVNPGGQWGSYPGIPCWICQTDKNYKSGVTNFYAYPTLGAGPLGVRDALNWETSGHASSWKSFFWLVVYPGTTAGTNDVAAFYADVKTDVGGGLAVPAAVATGTLPNWAKNIAHFISIVGYSTVLNSSGGVDYNNSKIMYLDTCGKACGGGADNLADGTVRSVSVNTFYNAIKNLSGGAWVW